MAIPLVVAAAATTAFNVAARFAPAAGRILGFANKNKALTSIGAFELVSKGALTQTALGVADLAGATAGVFQSILAAPTLPYIAAGTIALGGLYAAYNYMTSDNNKNMQAQPAYAPQGV